MANYPQELAQDAVCQSHTGHMTCLWFLPTRPLRLNTNEWMNLFKCVIMYLEFTASTNKNEIKSFPKEAVISYTISAFGWKRCRCMIWSFRREVADICALPRHYAAYSDNTLQTFRDNLSVPGARVKKLNNKTKKMVALIIPIIASQFDVSTSCNEKMNKIKIV